ncbi:Uncharacterised protein [Candidatus Bilamarchaeum dharawalense]|uniref:Uncharacterized protein n=1 Tax=Candidatus Bilamarchaeum dharawalense TaxID=2885759 RepID=A0A5E4LUV0_9ARCH|nr:Uncharacterised protein [Candidatus Bilamarchaeum dharawalense]
MKEKIFNGPPGSFSQYREDSKSTLGPFYSDWCYCIMGVLVGATFLIEAIFRVGPHTILTGTVSTGVLTPGMKLSLIEKTLEVGKIESTGRQLSSAPAGSKVGISFVAVTESDFKQLQVLVKNTITLV